jgi:hypothetical protein
LLVHFQEYNLYLYIINKIFRIRCKVYDRGCYLLVHWQQCCIFFFCAYCWSINFEIYCIFLSKLSQHIKQSLLFSQHFSFTYHRQLIDTACKINCLMIYRGVLKTLNVWNLHPTLSLDEIRRITLGNVPQTLKKLVINFDICIWAF